MKLGYIPRTLDLQEKFLLWDMDQLIIAVIVVGVGVSTGFMISGIIAGSLTAWQYGKFKSGKHQKFAVHAMYWWLPSDYFVSTQLTPPSDKRYFLG